MHNLYKFEYSHERYERTQVQILSCYLILGNILVFVNFWIRIYMVIYNLLISKSHFFGLSIIFWFSKKSSFSSLHEYFQAFFNFWIWFDSSAILPCLLWVSLAKSMLRLIGSIEQWHSIGDWKILWKITVPMIPRRPRNQF